MLRWIRQIPLLGQGIPIIGGFGYDTVDGVALVMVSLELPLGIWLMKGFFDGIPWGIEQAALIDGCSRFRVWWEIMLPSICETARDQPHRSEKRTLGRIPTVYSYTRQYSFSGSQSSLIESGT